MFRKFYISDELYTPKMVKKLLYLAILSILIFSVIGTVELIQNIPTQTWAEDTQHTLNLSDYYNVGSDYNITYTSVNDITVSNDGLIITFTPLADFNGQRNIVFNVSNSTTYVASNNVLLNITNVNDAPVIDSIVPSGTTASVVSGLNLLFNVTISDVDQDSLTYSWKVDGTQEATTQAFTFNKAVGTYVVNVTVSDGIASVENSWTVTSIEPTSAAVSIVESKILIGTSNNVRNTTITGTFKIKNIGSIESLSGINITDAINVKYKVGYSLTQGNYQDSLLGISLTAGQEKTIYVESYIPIAENSGEHIIGNFDVKSKNQTLKKDLYIYPISYLEFEDIDIKIGSKTRDVSEDRDFDVEPGDSLKLEVKVENTFPDDIKIEDIVVEGTIEDLDDGDDESEDASEFDLKDGRDKTVTLDFKVPYDVDDEDTFNFIVTAEGEDELGATHFVEMRFTITINKDDNDIRIKTAQLTSSLVKCDRNVQLIVEVANFGSDDQDEVRLVITNSQLGLNYEKSDIELDSDYDDDDNEFRVSKSIILADDFPVGRYPILVKLYRDDTKLMQDQTVYLEVGVCTTQPSVPSTGTGSTTTPIQTQPAGDEIVEVVFGQSTPTTTVEDVEEFTDSFEYTLLMIALAAIVLGLMIYGIGYLVIKAKK